MIRAVKLGGGRKSVVGRICEKGRFGPRSERVKPDAVSAATLPIYGLGQAPSMVACTPSGLVNSVKALKRNTDVCNSVRKYVNLPFRR